MTPVNQWQLYCDGASRNNPGNAGAGVYITKNDSPFLHNSYSLGIKTNNEAEYLALLLGLYLIEEHWDITDSLAIFSDSQLLIRQLSGQYRVREPRLVPLYTCARSFLAKRAHELTHIPREQNKVADRLANKGIDKGTRPPEAFWRFCDRFAS